MTRSVTAVVRFAVFVAGLVLLIYVGRSLAVRYGIELTPASIQDFNDWIETLGWLGPLAYIILVVVRLFIGLSSHLILILGGIAFGVVGGIVWGGIGLTLSGCVQYGLGHYFGSEWVSTRLGENNARLKKLLSRSGVPALFFITVHPLGPQSPLTVVAGAIRFNFTKFLVTMIAAAPIRAGIYAVLGASVLELDLRQIMLITLGLVIAIALPLLHPKTRAFFKHSTP